MNHLLLITAQTCGHLDGPKINKALESARTGRLSLLDALIEANPQGEHHFLYHLSVNSLMTWWEPQHWNWNHGLSKRISEETAQRFGVVPILQKQGTTRQGRDVLLVATYFPNSTQITTRLEHESGMEVEMYLTTRTMVRQGLLDLYGDALADRSAA